MLRELCLAVCSKHVLSFQKPVPSPQPPQYVPVEQPYSPTSVRPPGAPFPQQLMMVSPQQFGMYRGKQPGFKKRLSEHYLPFFLSLITFAIIRLHVQYML